MDFTNLTFAGLFAIGVVNVILFFYPALDNKVKFSLSFVAAFVALLVPADLGNMILNVAKEAIAVAFVASGGYKLSQVIGER